MKKIFAVLGVFWGSVFGFSADDSDVSPQVALDELMQGNQRYITGKLDHPNQGAFHREALAQGQEPFAVIVSCSDSRVPPEIIFDRGLGDTFVVRVAGNVVGSLEIESILYAVDILKAPLIMVLGHSNCGAINAAVKGGAASKDIPEIAKKIAPAIKAASHGLAEHGEKITVNAVVKTNVEYVRDQLKAIPLLSRLIKETKLLIVGGFYNLEDGTVTVLAK